MAYGNQNHRRFDGYRSGSPYQRRYNRRPNVPANQPANGEEVKTELRYPGLPRYVQNVEPHIVRLIRVLHANADIRRYTALGILSRLMKQGVITPDGNYIRFRWDKYTVCSKGINTDYRYSEQVFLEAFAGSFNILNTVASKSLDNFCKCELDKGSGEVLKDDAVNEPCNDIIARQVESDENIANFEDE